MRVERVVVTNETCSENVFATCTLKNAMTLLSAPEPCRGRTGRQWRYQPAVRDILNLVGRPSAIDAVANVLGMRSKNCNRFRCCQCLLASGWRIVRFYSRLCAWVPGRVETGLAGGPLIMALILGRIGSIASCTGLCLQVPTSRCGSWGSAVPLGRWSEIWWGFCKYPGHGEGLSWIGYGALITAVPLIMLAFWRGC